MKKVLLSTAVGAFLLFAAGPSFALDVEGSNINNSTFTATENDTDVDVDAELEFTDVDVNKTYTKTTTIDSNDTYTKTIDSNDTFTKTEVETEIDTEINTQQNQVTATQLLGAAVSGNFVTLAAGGNVSQAGSGIETELETGNVSSSMSGDGLSTSQGMTGIHNAGVNAVGLTVQMNNSGL